MRHVALRLTAALTAAVALVAGGATAPATAADLGTYGQVACDSSPYGNPIVPISADVAGTVGDTFTITVNGGLLCFIRTTTPGVISWIAEDCIYGWVGQLNEVDSWCGTDPDYSTITVTLQAAGSTTFTVIQNDVGGTFRITVQEHPAGLSAAAVTARPSDGTSEDWHLAHAREEGETCAEGWDESWHEWAEDVSGGWVCTRTAAAHG